MDFTFDVAQTPLIGRRILIKSETGSAQNLNRNNGQPMQHLNHAIGGTPNSPRRSASLSPADTAPLSGWKRPWLSQSRVRECLVNLLTTCGQRVGLPKSPSVCYDHSHSIEMYSFCFGSFEAFYLATFEHIGWHIHIVQRNFRLPLYIHISSKTECFLQKFKYSIGSTLLSAAIEAIDSAMLHYIPLSIRFV